MRKQVSHPGRVWLLSRLTIWFDRNEFSRWLFVTYPKFDERICDGNHHCDHKTFEQLLAQVVKIRGGVVLQKADGDNAELIERERARHGFETLLVGKVNAASHHL